jgi:uncharacterized protein
MESKNIIKKTEDYVRISLKKVDSGHDWHHINRVRNMSLYLSQKHKKVNLLILELGALLHDIADKKFNKSKKNEIIEQTSRFLQKLGVKKKIIEEIIFIIENISYRDELKSAFIKKSIELQIIQDADRLDAIGAIGIARAFNYGGYNNNTIYDPEIKFIKNISPEEYKNNQSTTINHFYEKLLLLKDKMNTKEGKKLAKKRHKFMLEYLKQFYSEWNGEK